MSFKVNALFDQKLVNISADNIEVNNLCLCSHIIDSSENIYEISITKDFVIITTEYAVQSKSDTIKNATTINRIFTNNINAYDWNGNHLWNIADIVGDLKIPYLGGSVTTKEIMKNHFGFDELKYDDSCELFCCSACNYLYIIDLKCRKLVQVLETR
jgi:hypothetical protein